MNESTVIIEIEILERVDISLPYTKFWVVLSFLGVFEGIRWSLIELVERI